MRMSTNIHLFSARRVRNTMRMKAPLLLSSTILDCYHTQVISATSNSHIHHSFFFFFIYLNIYYFDLVDFVHLFSHPQVGILVQPDHAKRTGVNETAQPSCILSPPVPPLLLPLPPPRPPLHLHLYFGPDLAPRPPLSSRSIFLDTS